MNNGKKIAKYILIFPIIMCTALSFAEEIKVEGQVAAPPDYGLPKTGQTTQYSGKLDDGYYQMGYPILPTITRFVSGTGLESGTVMDNATGLMWEQKDNVSGSIHYMNNTYAWSDAFEVFIKTLNDTNFAGHDDWRLPNINELRSIMFRNRYYVPGDTTAPYVDPIFVNTYFWPGAIYWSSTTFVVSYPYPAAWSVDFRIGTVGTRFKYNTAYVRAVRGGGGGIR